MAPKRMTSEVAMDGFIVLLLWVCLGQGEGIVWV